MYILYAIHLSIYFKLFDLHLYCESFGVQPATHTPCQVSLSLSLTRCLCFSLSLQFLYFHFRPKWSKQMIPVWSLDQLQVSSHGAIFPGHLPTLLTLRRRFFTFPLAVALVAVALYE